MNKVFKIMGIAALMTGMTTGAMAQEQTKETEKSGFFKQAFRDMKESVKRNPEVRKMVQEQEYQQQMTGADIWQDAVPE